jgi:hypothetical protein
MALPKPDDKDLSKLHSEVNQYINHRFIIATTAVTISGVVLGWIVSGTSIATTPQQPQVREVAFVLSVVLLLILGVLFVVSQIINGSIAVITSYLRVTESSVWEVQYKRLVERRKLKWIGQKEAFSVLFMALGVISGGTPFCLGMLFGFPSGTRFGILVTMLVVVLIIYGCMVVLAWLGWILDLGAEAEQHWREM